MPSTRTRGIRTTVRLLTAAATVAATSFGLAATAGTPAGAVGGTTTLFRDTTAAAQYVVPAGIHVVHIRAVGGSGAPGQAYFGAPGGAGGLGGRVDANVSVTPGETLTVRPGGAGHYKEGGAADAGFTGGLAGYSDSDNYIYGRGTGGGASVVRRGSTPLVVAAGGGGGGDASHWTGGEAGGRGGDGGGGVGVAGNGASAGESVFGILETPTGGPGGDAPLHSLGGGGGGGGGGYAPGLGGGGVGGNAGGVLGAGTAGGGSGGAGGADYAIDDAATRSTGDAPGDGQILIAALPLQVTGQLTLSASSVLVGKPVTIRADITSDPAFPATGTVSIGTYNPTTGQLTPLSTWDVTVNAHPSFTTTFPVGTTRVYAQYSGDQYSTPWRSSYYAVTVERVRHQFTLSPSSLDFGARRVGSYTPLTATLTNTGNVVWKPGSVAFGVPGPFRVTSTTCAASVAVGATCTYTLSYAPTQAVMSANTFWVTDASGVTAAVALRGTAAAPTVTAVAPASGPLSGGTVVTITGTDLVGVRSVKFATGLATSVQCSSTTTCQATAPAGAARGTVNVRVTTGAGTSAVVTADKFRYV